jgi:hypothetical protein
MRKFLALLILAAVSTAMPMAAATAQAPGLGDLAWLNGCWRDQNEHRSITEVWVSPPAPVMMGYAFILVEGEATFWEQFRIELVEGVPVFVAMPNGAPAVRFAKVESGANSVRFENPAHDFPKRIVIARDGDMLNARISAGDDGVDFAFRHIDCAQAYEP